MLALIGIVVCQSKDYKIRKEKTTHSQIGMKVTKYS